MADIPVNDLEPRTQLVDAAGGTTSYSYGFLITDQTHLIVEQTVDATGVTTTLVLTTDYTVTGVNNASGGTIELVVASAIDDVITISRDVPFQRLNDYPTQGDFAAETVNAELDAMVLMMQQLERDIGRAFRLPSSDTATQFLLPAVDVRKSNFLYFDANGNPTAANLVPTEAAVITSFMNTALANVTDKESARTTFASSGLGTTTGLGLNVGGTTEIDLVAGYDQFYLGTTVAEDLKGATDLAEGSRVRFFNNSSGNVTFLDFQSVPAGYRAFTTPGRVDLVIPANAWVEFLKTATSWVCVRWWSDQAADVQMRLLDEQIFTASGTWTKPPGCTGVEVVCVAGGGGGGYAKTTYAGTNGTITAAAGGQGGDFARSLLNVNSDSVGDTETITVGAGGAGGLAASTTPATTGGDSSFGAHVIAKGGTLGTHSLDSVEGILIATPLTHAGTSTGDLIVRGSTAYPATVNEITTALVTVPSVLITNSPGGMSGMGFGDSNPTVFEFSVSDLAVTPRLAANTSTNPGYGQGGGGPLIISNGTAATSSFDGEDGADGIVIVRAYG